MADRVFLRVGKLGEGPCLARGQKERIVAEPARTAGRFENTPLTRSLYDRRLCGRRHEREYAAESRATPLRRDDAKGLDEPLVVRAIAGPARVAGRVNAGRSAQSVHFEARIVP